METPVWIVVSGILGILGFLLALCMAYLEWNRYHLPLHLRVHHIDIVEESEDAYLVLLRVVVVNPATQGQTVYHVAVGVPDKEFASQPHYQYNRDRNIVICKLPNGAIESHIRMDEILPHPLDIHPRQSHAGLIAVIIRKEAQVAGKKEVHLRLVALDVRNKKIAEFDQLVELKTHIIF